MPCRNAARLRLEVLQAMDSEATAVAVKDEHIPNDLEDDDEDFDDERLDLGCSFSSWAKTTAS